MGQLILPDRSEGTEPIGAVEAFGLFFQIGQMLCPLITDALISTFQQQRALQIGDLDSMCRSGMTEARGDLESPIDEHWKTRFEGVRSNVRDVRVLDHEPSARKLGQLRGDEEEEEELTFVHDGIYKHRRRRADEREYCVHGDHPGSVWKDNLL